MTHEEMRLECDRFERDIDIARARFGGLPKWEEEAMRAVFNAQLEIKKKQPIPSYVYGGVIGEYYVNKDGSKTYLK